MKSWFLAGDSPKEYATGIDEYITYEGKRVAFLRSVVDQTSGFGTLMQTFSANRYVGKRMRFSAVVMSEKVVEWAGLWMRVDGEKEEILAFDNMKSRSITGTTDWKKYQIVLDVRQEAKEINIGVLVSGKGEVWICNAGFEEAPNEPTTGQPEEPGNLDFAED